MGVSISKATRSLDPPIIYLVITRIHVNDDDFADIRLVLYLRTNLIIDRLRSLIQFIQRGR